MTLKINEKFKGLLPALSSEEYNQLEESILSEGVRESIKVWNETIVDGHNRYSVCEKHGLNFETAEMFFDSEDSVLEWIYINQLGRRNLTKDQRLNFIGELYNLRKKQQGGDRKSNRHNDDLILTENKKVASRQSGDLPKLEPSQPKIEVEKTAEIIAKEFNVSPRTVERAGQTVEAVRKYPELSLIPTQKDRLTIAKNLDALPDAKRAESREKLKIHDAQTVTQLAEKPPMREREFASGESPAEKWAKLIGKSQILLTQIQDNGGIENLWKKWTNPQRKSYYQSVCGMEKDFSNLREIMEDILQNENARQNVA